LFSPFHNISGGCIPMEWENSRTPPVPASHSLMSGNADPYDNLFGQLDGSSEAYYNNEYDAVSDTLNNLPHLGWPTTTTTTTTTSTSTGPIKHNLHIYPPQPTMNTMIDSNGYAYVVPTYDANSPISPHALHTPSPNTSMASPAGTVPSPISPQHSPTALVPVDVKPDMKKLNGTGCEQWETYVDTGHTYYGLYNSKHQPISSTIALRSRIVAENLEYSPIDSAYILYRQNQLKVEIDFVGVGLTNYTTTSPSESYFIVKDTPMGPAYVNVEGLYFYMYSVKHTRGQAFDPDLVDITQAHGPRHTKDNQAPSYCPIESGRGSFPKLRFTAATLNNARSGKGAHSQPNAQQQYYRIVVALVAKVGEDEYEYIYTSMSPCLIVRGQNPKSFKDKDKKPAMMPVKKEPLKSDKEKSTRSTKKRKSCEEEEDNSYHPSNQEVEIVEHDNRWAQTNVPETIFVKDGKVGINTTAPPQALSVNGNIMLTGSILKPSDQRIKTNIQEVSTAGQLEKIKQLKIYDYELKHGKEPGATGDKERGILAQELKEVLPSATRTLKDVTMADGAVMEELIVVEERNLLYESIGATQELSNIVKKDQEKLLSIDNKINTCIQEETTAAKKTLAAAGSLLDYILLQKTAKSKANDKVCCLMVTHTKKGFYGSVFSLGPAWTLYLIGLYCPPLWFFGILFLFSPNKKRKLAGAFHLGSLALWGLLFYLYTQFGFAEDHPFASIAAQAAVGVVGTIAAGIRWNYKRKVRSRRIEYRRQKMAQSQKESLPEYVLQVSNNGEKQGKYTSIPLEDIETAVDSVNGKIPKAMIAAGKAKNASFAEEEWERNSLLRNDVAV